VVKKQDCVDACSSCSANGLMSSSAILSGSPRVAPVLSRQTALTAVEALGTTALGTVEMYELEPMHRLLSSKQSSDIANRTMMSHKKLPLHRAMTFIS
jgi:hypothetical protein